MGAGKSLLIEEICATARLAREEIVVVSTSTQHLVEDLAAALRARCRSARSVGFWYGRKKRLGDVVVSCYDSTAALAAKLKAAGKTVALWVADECHRTECTTVLRAHKMLGPAHALGLTATPFRADARWESISLFDRILYRYTAAQAQKDGVVVPWRIVHSGTGGELDEVCLEMVREATGPGLANAVDIADAEGFAKRLTAVGVPAKPVHSRQKRHTQKRVIADLRDGKLRCIVHVNMLSEGANFPWLRWLCLRREVESRVRFVQEVGRLLRSHPGKTEAVFYDPHDLFGSFSLSYAEALGEPPEKPEYEGVLPQPAQIAARVRDADDAVALAWIESVVRSHVVAAETEGLPLKRRILRKAERLVPATPLQRAALATTIQSMNGTVPEGWKECLAALTGRVDALRFGFAADLLAVLDAAKMTRTWPVVQTRDVRLVATDGQQLAFEDVVR